ncbi:hypothetical protein [Qipengyuania vesicularis]|uniref:hypothetical protein n=1 Tax=Qipengyuania vesicularis TaxID=2867232 RepID=UPI001C86BC51|nr:hypothetical protein [Qipengyuania vesicularis]MBX7526888.1 hypothetical protein [Qipengyuania vesicularis]
MIRALPVLVALAAAPLAAQEDKKAWPIEAQHRLGAVAACIVNVSHGKADRLLTSDFRTSSYRKGLERLANDNRGCWRENKLRASYGLPFAGALAEAMLERGEGNLIVRMAQARETERLTFSATDAMAHCVVKARPGVTASLFGTEIGSDAESQAVVALSGAIADCASANGIDGPVRNIRYLLATASYRLVAAHEEQVGSDA